MGTFDDCWNTFSLSDGPDTTMDLLLDQEFNDYNINYDDLSLIHSDLYTLDTCRTIHDDIKQIESSGSVSPSDTSVTSEPDIDIKPKIEIRNVDCMWSGLGNLNNLNISNQNQNQNQHNDRKSNQKIQQLQISQQRSQNTITTTANNNNNSINNNNNSGNNTTSIKFSPKNKQNIPPGASLLKNSRLNQQKKLSNNKFNNILSSPIPNILASDFLKDRETTTQSSMSSITMLARPDTPLSLDDDAPEFKHTVDLAACITGSNNICLDLNMQEMSDKMIINKLKEQLEDTSTENIDIRKIIPGKKRSLTEVLHAINSIDSELFYDNNNSNCSNSSSNNNNNMNNYVGNSFTTQFLNQQQKQKKQLLYGDGINTAPDTELSQSSSESEGDDDDDEIDDDEDEDDDAEISSSSCVGQNIFRQPPVSQFRKNNNYTTYIDHSYTRSNESNVDVVGIGLETPSDSDEEIDVVSVGDKKLPTNPSDKDRRALQNKVANKISARIVKTPNGIRTIPPRKRGNGGIGGGGCGTFDPPYAIIPISSMVTSPIKSISVGNPRFNNNSGNNSHCKENNNHISNKIQQNIETKNNYNNSSNCNNNNNSISAGRKRNSTQNSSNATTLSKQNQYNDEYLPPSKRSRSNGGSISSRDSSNSSGNSNSNNTNSNCSNNSSSGKNNKKTSNSRRNYDIEEQDTIEKRNLHNDMERQRRIGLKNLFEELKKQIPSIKDKERAPKVHILREAAKLCEQLMHDEKTIQNQKNQLLMQIHRKKEYLEAKYK